MVNWLSLLEPTETSTVTNLPQENFPSTGGEVIVELYYKCI